MTVRFSKSFSARCDAKFNILFDGFPACFKIIGIFLFFNLSVNDTVAHLCQSVSCVLSYNIYHRLVLDIMCVCSKSVGWTWLNKMFNIWVSYCTNGSLFFKLDRTYLVLPNSSVWMKIYWEITDLRYDCLSEHKFVNYSNLGQNTFVNSRYIFQITQNQTTQKWQRRSTSCDNCFKVLVSNFVKN